MSFDVAFKISNRLRNPMAGNFSFRASEGMMISGVVGQATFPSGEFESFTMPHPARNYIANHVSFQMAWSSPSVDDSIPIHQILIETMEGIKELARMITDYLQLGIWCLIMVKDYKSAAFGGNSYSYQRLPVIQFAPPLASITRCGEKVQAQLDQDIHFELTSGDQLALLAESNDTLGPVSLNAAITII